MTNQTDRCTGECDPTTGAYKHKPDCPDERRRAMAAARDELEHWVARGAADDTELQEGHGAINAYHAAVLRKAAALGRELSRQGYSAQEIAKKLDRMAEDSENSTTLN